MHIFSSSQKIASLTLVNPTSTTFLFLSFLVHASFESTMSSRLLPIDSNAAPPAMYTSMTNKELKAACKAKGLKVSGNKGDLLARLANPEASLAKRAKTGRGMSVAQVHAALTAAGYEHPEVASACIKKAIQRGHVSLQVKKKVFSGRCCGCSATLSCTLEEALGQSDYGGNDYEDGGENGALQCEECETGLYVTGFCEGNPSVDSGKFHNHCTECPGFGCCIGDYREAHCPTCNRHFFAGCSGFSCPTCSKSGRGGYIGCSDEGSEGSFW